MHKRIKELSLAASDTIPDDTSVEHALYLFQKNFAEKIIQECINVCANGYQGEFTTAGISQCITDLKQHFGV